MKTQLTREIGIDVGHRVPDHASKCRAPHGHRYRILATCEGQIIDEKDNPENGMVIDFSNIKKYMMDLLDAAFDHGFVISSKDTAMMSMFFPGLNPDDVLNFFTESWESELNKYVTGIHDDPKPIFLPRTCVSEQDPNGMKVIVVPYTPTAENLASHMFQMLKRPIQAHYGRDIQLHNIVLFETPNGSVMVQE